MSKIVSLQAENVKRLVAVRVDADGKPIITISGNNGAGKSSVLDSIMYALGGKDACCAEPIRNGEDKAEVTLRTDSGLIVKRKWSRSKSGNVTSQVEVTQDTENGKAKLQSPQALLDSLCGSLAFDPLAFTRLKPKDQLDQLKELVGVSTDDIDAAIDEKFRSRTDVNRRVKELEGQVAGAVTHADAPAEEVSVAGLMAKVQEAQRKNRDADELDRKADAAKHASEVRQARVDELKRLLAEAEAARDVAVDEASKLMLSAASATRVDVQPLFDAVNEAEGVNRKVRDNATAKALALKLDNAKEEAATLSKAIDDLRVERQLKMEQAAWPVSGLGFGESGVTLNGLPFDQASQAEKIRVGMAMAFASQPKLKVALIRDASLMDANSLRIVHEMCLLHDAQAWLEIVGDDETATVVIEDGEVRAREPAERELAAV